MSFSSSSYTLLDLIFPLIFYLVAFILYLLLPRGFRQYYCGSYPIRRLKKEYRKVYSKPLPQAQDYSSTDSNTHSTSLQININPNPHHFSLTPVRSPPPPPPNNPHPLHSNLSFTSSASSNTSVSAVHQPRHPLLYHIEKTITSKTGGYSLLAHPSKGKPKQILIRLTDVDLIWKTALLQPSNVQQSQRQSKDHTLPLANILFISLGRRTPPLQSASLSHVNPGLFFSLLTRDGSLDIQCVNYEEREGVVKVLTEWLQSVRGNGENSVVSGSVYNMGSEEDEEGRGSGGFDVEVEDV